MHAGKGRGPPAATAAKAAAAEAVPEAQGKVEGSAPKFEKPSSQPPLNASQIPVKVIESAPKFEMQSSQPPPNASQAAQAVAMANLRASAAAPLEAWIAEANQAKQEEEAKNIANMPKPKGQGY